MSLDLWALPGQDGPFCCAHHDRNSEFSYHTYRRQKSSMDAGRMTSNVDAYKLIKS